MPTYFFHLDGDPPVSDDAGSVFSTTEEAISHAHRVALEFNRISAFYRHYLLRVVDERGDLICKLQVGEISPH